MPENLRSPSIAMLISEPTETSLHHTDGALQRQE